MALESSLPPDFYIALGTADPEWGGRATSLSTPTFFTLRAVRLLSGKKAHV